MLLLEPLALLSIPANHGRLSRIVAPKVCNKIRKAAKNGYSFREFEWNEHLDDIYAINTSKTHRSAGIMRGWYTRAGAAALPPENVLPFRKYFGAFKGNRCAPICICSLQETTHSSNILSDMPNDLPNGVMNGLIYWTVQQFIGHPTLRWLKYGFLPRRYSGSLYSFRRHSGFVGYATVLDLTGRPDLLAQASAVELSWWAV